MTFSQILTYRQFIVVNLHPVQGRNAWFLLTYIKERVIPLTLIWEDGLPIFFHIHNRPTARVGFVQCFVQVTDF